MLEIYIKSQVNVYWVFIYGMYNINIAHSIHRYIVWGELIKYGV